jgi:hypothetical protein
MTVLNRHTVLSKIFRNFPQSLWTCTKTVSQIIPWPFPDTYLATDYWLYIVWATDRNTKYTVNKRINNLHSSVSIIITLLAWLKKILIVCYFIPIIRATLNISSVSLAPPFSPQWTGSYLCRLYHMWWKVVFHCRHFIHIRTTCMKAHHKSSSLLFNPCYTVLPALAHLKSRRNLIWWNPTGINNEHYI